MNTIDKLMIGVAAGAILGILYAPDKGSATRRKLARTGDSLRDKINGLKSKVTDQYDNLTDDVNDIVYEEMAAADDQQTINTPRSWQ